MLWPSFNKGSVLKQNMLEVLRDYPHTVLDVLFSDFGDGIISGFNIQKTDDKLFHISPGILKFENKIHISSKILTVEQELENHYVYLYVTATENPDGTDISIECEQTTESYENRFELFRYTKNAEVFEYKDIYESFKKPINRINQIYCKYAIIGGSTLHPKYYNLFAEEILKNNQVPMKDEVFAFQCLNGINNINVINNYFDSNCSNFEIIAQMKLILERLKSTKNEQIPQAEKVEKPRRMIIS